MSLLSKSRIIAHRQCPKRLWLQTYRPELIQVDPNSAMLMAVGNQVGEIARTLYPEGVLIDGNDLTQALADTARELAEAPHPIFEATLRHEGVLIRADLLLPDNGGYRLVEVKSSASVKDYHREDAAIQTWVLKQVGIPVTRTEIAYVDSTFVYKGDGDYRALFSYEDITGTVEILQSSIPEWVHAARTTVAGVEPDIAPGKQCKSPFACPFIAYCTPEPATVEGYPPETLPNDRNGKVAAGLRADGYEDLRQVPENRLTSEQHRRIRRACISGSAKINAEAGRQLAALPYPRCYMDFETIQFAAPIWGGTKSRAQIPFQWSCHVEHKQGKIVHHEFLADSLSDPRRAFSESLLNVLGDEGPIFVYSAGFERSRLRELATELPDLAERIEEAIDRLVDLLPIARANYYHPAMRGSWSIKQVLPTIAPELTYDALAVANGMMAQAAFMKMTDAATSELDRRKLRTDLLEYCCQDTLAMVRLAHFFLENQ